MTIVRYCSRCGSEMIRRTDENLYGCLACGKFIWNNGTVVLHKEAQAGYPVTRMIAYFRCDSCGGDFPFETTRRRACHACSRIMCPHCVAAFSPPHHHETGNVYCRDCSGRSARPGVAGVILLMLAYWPLLAG